jgi:hypothetical protein
LTPETLRSVNDLIVKAAVEMKFEDGKKLRTDTTVVQTDIHHPTNNTLLFDAVRVVTRSVGRLFDGSGGASTASTTARGRRVAACKKSSA